ncbi:hypothetical protein QUF90_11150 [Desulfococcaceae bacterium HSG9]|nr:hypothetical protein [Desulfococcaceae bacterium HSG9]
MTYNFDPDRWYENEIAYLQDKLKSETISEKDFKKAAEKLDQRYEEMWKRLDGTYLIHGILV